MRYLKAVAVGFVGAVTLALVWGWSALNLPIWWQMWQQRNEGGGVAASVVGSGSILVAAVIGFALGFCWFVRRNAPNRGE